MLASAVCPCLGVFHVRSAVLVQDVVEGQSSLDAWVANQLWIDIVGPGRSGILPAVLHPLPVVYASGVIHLVPFHAIDDVVDVHKPGFGKRVDRSGATAPRPAHDQERVGGREQTLHVGDEIGIGLHNELVVVSVPLVFNEDDGNVPRHFRMADENVLFRGANVDDVDPLGLGLPHLVSLFSRHIKPQACLLSFGHLVARLRG